MGIAVAIGIIAGIIVLWLMLRKPNQADSPPIYRRKEQDPPEKK